MERKKIDVYYLTQVINYQWAYLNEKDINIADHWLDIKYGFINGIREESEDPLLGTFVSQIVSYLCYENYNDKKDKPTIKDVAKVLRSIDVDIVNVLEDEILDNLERGE